MKRWAPNKHFRREFGFATLLTLCFVFLLWPGFAHDRVPGFRDTYHFYYPQLAWLDHQVQQGNFFPAWSPLDGTGISTRGQGTCSLYYPLRLIYLIPTSLPSRLSLFILTHLLIAALGIRLTARRLGISTSSGWLAASSFSLSCPVFFQHSNLIYLASAAWIGFAFSGVHCMVSAPRDRHDTLLGSILLGAATAMMVLAGDPHTAVNSVLLAVVYTLALVARSWWRKPSVSLQFVTRSMLNIAAAVSLCCVLTIVQWVPLLRAAQNSRAANSHATSTPALSHRVYDFSLSPWHTLTCLLPNLGGSFTPDNSRLFESIGSEGRMWIPSLYFGCIPLFGLILGRDRSQHRLLKPLLWIAGFSLLAAFGSYSLVWLLREILRAAGASELASSLPRDPTTGVYWLLTCVVPGYEMFRYPAKWTVWFAAAASLSAGVAWQPTLSGRMRSSQLKSGYAAILTALFVGVGVCGLAGLVASSLGWPGVQELNAWLIRRHSDAWLGHATVRTIAKSITISAAVPVCCLGSVQVLLRTQRTGVIALLAMAELTLVAMQWIVFVEPPRPRLEPPTIAGSTYEAFVWVDTQEANLARDLRLDGSATTAQTMCQYQDQMLLGKIANTSQLRCLSSSLTLTPRPLARITGHLSRLDNLTKEQPRLDAALAEIGVTHRLTRSVQGDQVVFEWYSVEGARPLCSLVRQAAPSSIHWAWSRCDELSVHMAADQRDLLVVRQFNDGGWKAKITPAAGDHVSKLLKIETTELGFLQFSIPRGSWHLVLTRKPLW